MKEVLQRAIKDAIEQMGVERFKETSFFGSNYKPKGESEMNKVEQAVEKGGPWLTVEEALQATGGLPFTQEDRGRATQWLEGNCHLVRHWTLPKILAAYASHVTAEKDKEIGRLRNALAFMKGAVDSCIKPTAYPHRVVFKDGFVIEGRAANEWFNLLTVLREFCSRYLDGEKGSTRLAKLEAVAEAVLSELSGNPSELRDQVASAIRGDGSDLCDAPWEILSDDRKTGWRGDADRAIAAVKNYLITKAALSGEKADG